MLDGLQKGNIFDQILLDFFGRDPILRAMLLTVTLFVVLVGLRRLFRSRQGLDKTVPLLVGLTSEPAIPGLLDKRHQALKSGDNFWEPAQVLLRQWLVDHDAPEPPRWEQNTAPPGLIIAASSKQARRLRNLVHKVWRWASAWPGTPLPSSQFMKLMAEVEELSKAWNDQEFRFARRTTQA